jgi:opacity protein-like surface antigen
LICGLLETRMFAKPVFALAMLCGLGLAAGLDGEARADDQVKTDAAPTPQLPVFAANSQQALSPWTGLYAGTDIFAVSRSGKGAKGVVGGGAFIGYNREFDNNLVLGIEASTGFAPGALQRSAYGRFNGFDYAAAKVKVGYDMGQFLPYLTAGVAIAKPDFGSHSGYVGLTNSFNDLLGSSGGARTFGMVGAGVDYKVTNNLTVGVAVSAGNGRVPIAP